MSTERDYHVTIQFVSGYQFLGVFDDVKGSPTLLLDEPPPLGESDGPNAAAVLAVAVGNCLAASLAFCLRKVRLQLDDLTAHVTAHVARNEQGRFRVSGIDVELKPELPEMERDRFARCEALFEDFCVVTESVRRGIPVNVTVSAGKELPWPK
jgi:uncharacterized OsmC-like protein